jgi:hypothetical protein
MSVTTAVRRTASTAQSLLLLTLPHGGQEAARRNAWASMSADVARARARVEADAAMDRAVAIAHHPAVAR